MYHAGCQALFVPEESAAAVDVFYQAVFGIIPMRIVVESIPVVHRYPQIGNDTQDVGRVNERLVFGAADAATPTYHRCRLAVRCICFFLSWFTFAHIRTVFLVFRQRPPAVRYRCFRPVRSGNKTGHWSRRANRGAALSALSGRAPRTVPYRSPNTCSY